jgi:hypothetical protein
MQRGRSGSDNAPSKARTATLYNSFKDPLMKYLAVVLALLCTSQAQATTRSYSFSEPHNRIGTCLADGTSCGKIAADAFCKKEGFAESVLFAREKTMSARILDSDAKCEGAQCEAFKRIKCYQPIEETARNSNQAPG